MRGIYPKPIMIEADIYSNPALISIEHEGVTWHSAEQYYQAAKFTDEEIVDKIRRRRNPHLCAALG